MQRCVIPLLAGLMACSARGPLNRSGTPDAGGAEATVPADSEATPDAAPPPPDSGTECAAPRALCAGQCVDRSTDANHCGACNNRCATGRCVEGACSGTPTCASPRVL